MESFRNFFSRFPHSLFSILPIFHTSQFSCSSFSTLLIFYTSHFSILLIFDTLHFPQRSALRVFHTTREAREALIPFVMLLITCFFFLHCPQFTQSRFCFPYFRYYANTVITPLTNDVKIDNLLEEGWLGRPKYSALNFKITLHSSGFWVLYGCYMKPAIEF